MDDGLSKWRISSQPTCDAATSQCPNPQQEEEPDEIDHEYGFQSSAITKVAGDTNLDPFHTYPSPLAIEMVGQLLRHGKCVDMGLDSNLAIQLRYCRN
jgi:hypothetical protein